MCIYIYRYIYIDSVLVDVPCWLAMSTKHEKPADNESRSTSPETDPAMAMDNNCLSISRGWHTVDGSEIRRTTWDV